MNTELPSLKILSLDSFDSAPGSYQKSLISYDEFIQSDANRLILSTIPSEGPISLQDLERTLDTTTGLHLSLEAIKDAVYDLWKVLEIQPGVTPADTLIRHTDRSRALLLYAPITQEASTPYRGQWFLDNERFPWMVAGSAEYSLTDKCAHVVRFGASEKNYLNDRRVSHLWCYNSLCPTCWGSWASRQKDELVDRLIGGYLAYKRCGIELGQLNYWFFSPPQREAIALMQTPGGYRKLVKWLYRTLEAAGVKAFVYGFHPWRVQHWAKQAFKAVKRKGYEGGIWQWLRDNDLLTPDKDALVFSPHFHVWGYGYIPCTPDELAEASDGWRYHKTPTSYTITPRGDVEGINSDTGSKLTRDDLEAQTFYVLSHTGVMFDTEKPFTTVQGKNNLYQKRYTPILTILPGGLFSSQKLGKSKTSDEVEAWSVLDNCPIVEYNGNVVNAAEPGEPDNWVPDWDNSVPTNERWLEVVITRYYWVRALEPGPPGEPPAGDPDTDLSQ